MIQSSWLVCHAGLAMQFTNCVVSYVEGVFARSVLVP
jgi:hypothetical protein